MLTRGMTLGSQLLAEMYPIVMPLTVVLATGILFLLLLLMWHIITRFTELDKKQIRRALTVAVVSLYFGIILCAVAGIFEPSEEFFKLIDSLNLAFITTVSFYFGSRTVEEYIKDKAKNQESAESRHHKEGEEQE